MRFQNKISLPMKNQLLLILLCAPFVSAAQNVDSTAIRQVDSLIQASRALTGKQDFDKALEVNAAAEKIALEKLGRESAAYGSCCFNHGRVLYFKGDYNEAEKWYLEAKALREKVLGKEHLDYAWSLNNLGNLYWAMVNYEKAEPFYLEAFAIREKVLGKEHLDYAASLGNLGILYKDMGYYEKAEPFYLEAKSIREKVLGKGHLDYATSLNNLGNLYWAMGNYEKAEPLMLEAKAILQKVLGKEHPNYATSLDNLGNLYSDMGNYEKAAPLYLESLVIREKVLGKEHPDCAASLGNLANLYSKMGNHEKAAPLYLEENNINHLLVKKAATYSSEHQMLQYLSTFRGSLETFLSFSQQHPSPEINRESYNNALFFNGLVLENQRLLARAIAGADTATIALYEKWQNARLRLAKRYAKPIAERKKIAETEAEAEGYEKMLMRSLPAFRETQTIPQWQDVRDQLKPGEAAIEFVHYRFYNPETTDSVLYAALMLQSGWDAPKMIPLFEEKQLDSLLLTTGGRKADYVARIYAVANRGIIVVDKPSKSLYELIWQPLEKELAGINTVYFVPTGLLHRLNLAAVPIDADAVLADRYQLVELGSTRSLVEGRQLESAGAHHNQDAVIFGGIQYEMDSTAIFAANARLFHSDIASRGLEETLDNFDANNRGGAWNYLKWTEKEVNTLAPILSAAGFITETRKGFDATEESFKNMGKNGASPRVIHLATHGFFFPDPKASPKQQAAEDEKETGFKTSDNPLIRSGLLMAGANYAWNTGKPIRKGMENGILTAYEISHLDLSNTELVVLSACETGLGDIAGNEGVFGLQRAFKIAGAKYLIMSLWQVPDFQTQDLMAAFYTYWLAEKKSIPEAFRAAQKDMREKYQDPYFWAGFVLVE
jgi:CHAT domain-containing protein/tetratricopeptide (TPR) repeat protein